METETRQALRRALLWTTVIAVAISSLGAYGMANNHSLQFLWLLGAPYALLLPVSMIAGEIAPGPAGWFAGVTRAFPVTAICCWSIAIAIAWGLGFLWPHFAFCATRQRKFLIRTWGFLGWCAFSFFGTMAFMFWAVSDMMD